MMNLQESIDWLDETFTAGALPLPVAVKVYLAANGKQAQELAAELEMSPTAFAHALRNGHHSRRNEIWHHITY